MKSCEKGRKNKKTQGKKERIQTLRKKGKTQKDEGKRKNKM